MRVCLGSLASASRLAAPRRAAGSPAAAACSCARGAGGLTRRALRPTACRDDLLPRVEVSPGMEICPEFVRDLPSPEPCFVLELTKQDASKPLSFSFTCARAGAPIGHTRAMQPHCAALPQALITLPCPACPERVQDSCDRRRGQTACVAPPGGVACLLVRGPASSAGGPASCLLPITPPPRSSCDCTGAGAAGQADASHRLLTLACCAAMPCCRCWLTRSSLLTQRPP